MQGGQFQPTTEQWLQILKRERKISKLERQVGAHLADVMHKDGWYILLFVFIQVLMVFDIWHKRKTIAPDKKLEPKILDAPPKIS